MALLEKPEVGVYSPLSPEKVRKTARTGIWDNDEAIKLVVQDAIRAENFEATKQWVLAWPTASALYQSPFTARFWEGTQTERANIPMFVLATAVNSLVPQVISGLFYENPPFIIQERPGTKAQAARAVGAILGFQLEDLNFREELRLGISNAVLFGTGIWKWGWETYTKSRSVYKRNTSPVTLVNPVPGAKNIQIEDSEEDIDQEVIEEYVDQPYFEHIVNLRQVLVDPGLNVPNIKKAKYVIHRLYLTFDDLDKLRNRPGYVIPSKEELIELFLPPKEMAENAPGETNFRNNLWDARSEPRYDETTIDPFSEPLEVLERWDKDKCIVVLQKKLVICNDANPYGEIPFLSVGWWDVPEAFWSMGLGKTIGSEQRLQQGITNTWLDQAALLLNGVYARVKGKSIQTQSIRISPGKIIDIENKGDIEPLKRPEAVPEAGQHLALSKARVEEISGANSSTTQGIAGESGHSNMARSAAGASILGAGAASRSQDFVEKIANQVFVPFLYSAHEMNRALLPLATIRYILNEELQHEFFLKGDGDILELLNARVKFSILAAAKMQARRNMAQALPIMIQFLTNQQTTEQLAIQGLKVDVAEVMRMMFEVSDWKNYNDVIIPMTKEDEQRWQQTTPAAAQQAKMQGQAQLMQQQFNNKSQLVDQENISRAGREVLRQAMEKATEPEEVSGLPTGQGFGANA